MAGISTSTGVGSGLQIESLVGQLVAAERQAPEKRLNNKQQRLEEDLSALGQFKGALSKFRDSLDGMKDKDDFEDISTSSTNSDVATASADSTAQAGTHDVEVNQLASAQRLNSGVFEGGAEEEVGTGELTFQFGSYDGDNFSVNPDRASQSLTIDAENNTLEGVRDTINEADMGVRANIVSDEGGARLSLTSEKTGKENAMRITVSDDVTDNTDEEGLSRLAYDPGSSVANLTENRTAQDAKAKVDGVDVESSNNTLDGVLEGVSIDLKEANSSTQIEVSRDSGGARKAIEGFVESYNGFMETANKLTEWDAEEEEGGPLTGDSTVRTAVSRLQRMLTEEVEGVSGDYNSLTQLGLETGRDGTLSIDDDQLNSALKDAPEAVGHLLANSGKASDELVRYNDATDETQPGQYGLDITQVAKQAQLTGADPINNDGSPVTIDDTNDSFALTVNGISSDTISLTHGEYDLQSLADEVQSRISGDDNLSDAGFDVGVEVIDDSNKLRLTSGRYGSDSQVSIDSGNDDLGLAAGQSAAGQDVAGSIGGATAEGFGQQLIARNGDAEGLSVIVDGGSPGDRGTVDYSRGFGEEMDREIGDFIDTGGSLAYREDSLNNRLEEVEGSREDLNERMSRLEDRYRSKFSSLDATLGEMQNTSSFLQNELGGGGSSLAGVAGAL